MKSEKELKELIAANITFYRKRAMLTQFELAEKINYSDKSVSKWERAEGLPDIYVLSLIAEACGTTTDALLKDSSSEKVPMADDKKRHRIIVCLSVGIALLLAATLQTVLSILGIGGMEKYVWCGFLVAASIVLTVFSKLWFSEKVLAAAVSGIIWSAAFTVFLCAPLEKIYFVFIIAAVLQIMAILWFALKKSRR